LNIGLRFGYSLALDVNQGLLFIEFNNLWYSKGKLLQLALLINWFIGNIDDNFCIIREFLKGIEKGRWYKIVIELLSHFLKQLFHKLAASSFFLGDQLILPESEF
jgi:hypothetical protein